MAATKLQYQTPEKQQHLLDLNIGDASLKTLINEAMRAVQERKEQLVFACANPHSLVNTRENPLFREALADTPHIVADGVGISLMARVVGVEVGPRITGSDYFCALMKKLNQAGGKRVFFLGSTKEVLDLLTARVKQNYPNVDVAGAISPPFGDWPAELDDRYVDEINRVRPDVLWVGMTAPKQEVWVHSNKARLDVPVIASVGAVFDFYSGRTPRAPKWMQHLGLEWFYRFLKEPRRMWKRNFISTPKFIGLVIKHHVLRTR